MSFRDGWQADRGALASLHAVESEIAAMVEHYVVEVLGEPAEMVGPRLRGAEAVYNAHMVREVYGHVASAGCYSGSDGGVRSGE